MKRQIILLWALVLLTALALVAAGCGQKQAAPAQKELKVASDTAYAPFEFQDEKTKEYVGFDMDLIRAIGKKMGMDVKILSTNFDGIIPALEAGNVDAAISAMTITDERKQKVIFSDPYYRSGLSIVVRQDNNTIKTMKDLEGKRIAVQIGTTGADHARKIAGAKVREFNTVNEAFLELKNGGADAVVNDYPVNAYFINQGHKDVKIVGDLLNAEEYGIAVSKKNPELAAKINKALADLKQSGEYNQIYEKWFGKPAK